MWWITVLNKLQVLTGWTGINCKAKPGTAGKETDAPKRTSSNRMTVWPRWLCFIRPTLLKRLGSSGLERKLERQGWGGLDTSRGGLDKGCWRWSFLEQGKSKSTKIHGWRACRGEARDQVRWREMICCSDARGKAFPSDSNSLLL